MRWRGTLSCGVENEPLDPVFWCKLRSSSSGDAKAPSPKDLLAPEMRRAAIGEALMGTLALGLIYSSG